MLCLFSFFFHVKPIAKVTLTRVKLCKPAKPLITRESVPEQDQTRFGFLIRRCTPQRVLSVSRVNQRSVTGS